MAIMINPAPLAGGVYAAGGLSAGGHPGVLYDATAGVPGAALVAALLSEDPGSLSEADRVRTTLLSGQGHLGRWTSKGDASLFSNREVAMAMALAESKKARSPSPLSQAFVGLGPATVPGGSTSIRKPAGLSAASGTGGRIAVARLKKLGIQPNDFDVELYHLGLKVKGRAIAFDMDQTIEDWSPGPHKEGPKQHYHPLQIKPGAIAYLLGLSQNNTLLLYSNSPPKRTLLVLNAFPALREIFGLSVDRELTYDDIVHSKTVFSLLDWRNFAMALLEKYERDPNLETFSEVERAMLLKILENPKETTVMKHPHIAESAGKLGFDTLVDDSAQVRKYLEELPGREHVAMIHLKSHPVYGDEAEMAGDINGQMMDLARAMEGAQKGVTQTVEQKSALPPNYPVQKRVMPYAVEDYEEEYLGYRQEVIEKARNVMMAVESNKIVEKVIAWRRAIHQQPELAYKEFGTAKLVEDHLRALGYEVQTGIAQTGVIGLLKGGKPGPVVALRADMDALPIQEESGLLFASTTKINWRGKEVPVAHACGHDAHTAILMGVAEVLSRMRKELPGTVKLIFQPAEEGAVQDTQESGAKQMIEEGVLLNPRPEAIFGLHVNPHIDKGVVGYRAGGTMASSDGFKISVKGRQTHGGMPWHGVDPIVVGAQILLGLQTITSRQLNVTLAPAVITVGQIHGGSTRSTVPASVEMEGTIRSFDPQMRKEIHRRIEATSKSIAEAAGATADVLIEQGNPITYNNPVLTAQMLPTLRKVFGEKGVQEVPPLTVAEDFAWYQQYIPGLFVHLGVRPEGKSLEEVAFNHSPKFVLNEEALIYGVRVLAHLAMDYLQKK